MSLKFILGRTGSGKTSFITDAMLSDSKNEHIYIVPEQFALQSEISLINRRPNIMNIKVLSFQRLAYLVLEETGGENLPVFDENAKIMLIRRIISQKRDELEYFSRESICSREGIIKKISETINEFITYDVTGDKLSVVLSEISKDSNELQLKTKLADISRIYSGYNEFLENKYINAQEKLDILCQKAVKSDLIKNATVWIDSFSGFTPKEISIIEQLICLTDVNIAFSMDNPNIKLYSFDPFEEQKLVIKNLTEFCAKNNAEVKENIWLSQNRRHKKGSELEYLERKFSDYRAKPFEGENKQISIFSAVNKYEEIKQTAFRILDLVKNKGYRYKDIGIITADDSYKQGIEDIFTRYSIPYFSDNELSLSMHSLSAFIISALRTVIYGYRYEDLFMCLKTPYALEGLCNINDSITLDRIYNFENYVLANGIKGEKKYSEAFEKGFRYSAFEREEINEVRSAVYEMFSKLKMKKATVENMTDRVIDFLREVGVDLTLEKMSEEDEISRGLNRQIWESITNLLETASEVFGDDKMTPEEYYKVISAGIENCRIAIAPSSADSISIGDLYRSRFPETKVIFVMNVNDGIFPQHRTDTGFISDNEKKKLKSRNITLSPDTNGLIQRDNLLIYTAFSRPSEMLFISYSKSGLKGESMKSALAVGRILKLFPNITENNDSFEFISKEETFDSLIKCVYDCRNTEIPDEYKDTAVWFMNDGRYSQDIEKIKKGLIKVNPPDLLSSENAKNVFADRTVASVTRIEDFNRCPFMYFVKYTLRAKERKIFEFGSADRGTMYHGIIERFSSSIKEQSLDWNSITPNDIKRIIDTAVESYINDLDSDILTETATSRYFVSKIKNTARLAANGVVSNVKKGKFVPLFFEYGFNTDESGNATPIIIRVNGKEILLIGTIDRIDEFIDDEEKRKYIKIVDYKSSEKSCCLEDIYMGVQIQLILYMDAYIKTRQLNDKAEMKPACALYMKFGQFDSDTDSNVSVKQIADNYKFRGVFVDEQNVKNIIGDSETEKNSKGFSESEFDLLMKYINFITESTCRNISDGNIEIKPHTADVCQYCDYSGICCIEIKQDGKPEDTLSFGRSDKGKNEFMEKIKERLGE